MQKTNKHYVSKIDIQLTEFDAINPRSGSQQAEIAKYQRLNRLRDKKMPRQVEPEKHWEGF